MLYNEATRQRVERASLFAAVINKGWQDKKEQEKLNKHLEALKNPYRTKPENSEGDWELLRSKQKLK